MARSIQTNGPERFTQAALAWQNRLTTAAIHQASGTNGQSADTTHGPVLFGGFSFDPLNPHTSALWQAFPAGLLILPTLLFSRRNRATTLTLSCLVQATDNLDKLADQLRAQ